MTPARACVWSAAPVAPVPSPASGPRSSRSSWRRATSPASRSSVGSARRLRRWQERALQLHREPPCPRGEAPRAVRGPGGRVLPARLRQRPGDLRRRRAEMLHFFASRLKFSRFAHVSLVDEREGRTARAGPPRGLRGLRGRAAPLGLRQPQDDRDPPRGQPHRVERDLRSSRSGPALRRRALLAAPAAGEGRRGEPGRLGQGILLQGPPLRRPRGPRAAAPRVAPRRSTRRGPPARPASSRSCVWPRSVSACAPADPRPGVRAALPGPRGPDRPWSSTRATATPCRPRRSASPERSTSTPIGCGSWPGRHEALPPARPRRSGTTSYCAEHRAKALAAVSGERAQPLRPAPADPRPRARGRGVPDRDRPPPPPHVEGRRGSPPCPAPLRRAPTASFAPSRRRRDQRLFGAPYVQAILKETA